MRMDLKTISAAIFAALFLTACAPSVQSVSAAPEAPPPVREIALTFDDAPMPDSHFMTGPARTERLIASLHQADVRGAMIFVIGNRVNEAGRDRLEAYVRAGHLIANHSETHTAAAALSPEAYLADVEQADAVVRPLPGFRPFFRYPYLDAGETIEKRDALRAGLRRLGYREGYITVDAFDWRMADGVDAAIARGDTVDWDKVRATYVDVIVRSVEFYDGLARRYLGRSPRHVLLLHENDLAALFIADAVAALNARGWRVIPAERAFADPISRITPDTMRLGAGQIVALADVAGAPGTELYSGLTDRDAIDALLAPAFTAKQP